MKILGLERFNIIDSQLSDEYSLTKFQVRIFTKYFNDKEVLAPLTPKERRLLICQFLRDQLKSLRKLIFLKQLEIIGTQIKPRGLQGTLTGKQLHSLFDFPEIENIFINQVNGQDPAEVEIEKQYYFSVQGLFTAEVEGFDYSNSVQLTEERMILVRACNINDAQKVAELEFKKYSSERYLNSDYQYVYWRYVELLDILETDAAEIDPNGTEVFSKWKRQKLNKANNKH